jgi:hypothetical protein
VNIAIVLTIVLGLYADQRLGMPGQIAASLVAWFLFGLLLWRATFAERVGLWACLVYATLGEVVLSLVFGLYHYRLHDIPLFVPPGHVLLFALGASLSQRVPARAVQMLPLAAAPLVAWLALTGADTLGPLLLGVLSLCCFLGPSKKLCGTMFVLALLMELYGTWLGNWTWASAVPGLPLTMANPPLTAGAFYCVLDVLVLATLALARKGLRPFPEAAARLP